MKQGILITAYKDQPQLERLVRFFAKDMFVAVHVDAKSKAIRCSEIERLGARVISKYSISWGGYNHILAIVDLLKMAFDQGDVGYVHVISGQDFPLHPLAWFHDRFDSSQRVYASCQKVDVGVSSAERMRFYVLSANLDQRNKWIQRMNRLGMMIQRSCGICRRSLGEFGQIYKGQVYVSLPTDIARTCVNYFEGHDRFRFDLAHALIPEEFFFQTLLMNLGFASQLENGHMRYIDWSMRNGSSPAYLDESDFEKIVANCGDYAFARKVDSQFSRMLISRIAQDLGVIIN